MIARLLVVVLAFLLSGCSGFVEVAGTDCNGDGLGGAAPHGGLDELDLPGYLSSSGCWVGATTETTCDPPPETDPPLLEDDVLQVPIGVCASVVYVDPDGARGDRLVEEYPGPGVITLPRLGWRIWLHRGPCELEGAP